jgi:hypothetical protein
VGGKREGPAWFPAIANFADWRDQSSVFESVAAYSDANFNRPAFLILSVFKNALVSPAFFTTLGITPILGRVFRRR